MRPEIINIDEETIVVEFFTHRKIYNNEDEFLDILVFPTLLLTKRTHPNGKFPLPIDEKMFTKELGVTFNGYTYGVGKIVRLAEINNDNLHKFIKKYFRKNDLETFYKKSTECAKLINYEIREKLEFLTYGNLKNIMRQIIKNDTAFHTIEELNNANKRRHFRQTYENYVVDRDRFTHGKLFFLYPDFDPVLRIRENNGDSKYINYSKEIFLSNLQTFDYLEKVLSQMNLILS